MEKAPPSLNRMLKKFLLYPPCLQRAGTHSFPRFVLCSENSSSYRWESVDLGRLRVARVKGWYSCWFFSPAALLAEAFELPEKSS